MARNRFARLVVVLFGGGTCLLPACKPYQLARPISVVVLSQSQSRPSQPSKNLVLLGKVRGEGGQAGTDLDMGSRRDWARGGQTHNRQSIVATSLLAPRQWYFGTCPPEGRFYLRCAY